MTTPQIRPEAWSEIRRDLADQGAEALLVSDPASVRYLSAFTSPDDGKVLVLPDRAVLLTDGRYTAQAEQESRLEVRIVRPWLQAVADMAEPYALAIEADALTVADHAELEATLGRTPIPSRGIVSTARSIKSSEEIDVLREAARLTDAAFDEALAMLRPGVREVDVAWHIASFLQEHGAVPAFDIVVASGHRSAMPHGVASNKKLAAGELVTLDLGARLHGYHADMTRTVALGSPSRTARDLYEAVLAAQQAALDAVRAGVSGKELDSTARSVLEERGLAEAFAHSLGHGVGLQIHEAPSLSQRSTDTLVPGMVVTVEPGAYFPGTHGVRIEDLVLVVEGGCEILSRSPKELLSVPAAS